MTLDERLAEFPERYAGLGAPVEIRWNDHAVPYLIAERDEDVPYALGIVHAHLRLGQMAIIRRLAQGRLSEMVGPLTTDIDHLLRTLDLGRAVPEMEAALPDDTRRWLQQYVDGVNNYRAQLRRPPYEHRVLGLDVDADPWTIADVLTIGRLASADLNWARWITELSRRSNQEWLAFAPRVRAAQKNGKASFGPGVPTPLDPITDVGRTGSNSVVVGGQHTSAGAALIASDPHLGIRLPNFWCLVGIRSPGLKLVGLTIPGLPFVLEGRNERIAWGGTNMQGVSSVLYDVSDLRREAFTPRRETIRRRFWTDAEVVIRETPFGPDLSRAPFFESLDVGPAALKWRGHEPSDEATTFLRVHEAGTWDEFLDAFQTYAVGAQNFLYADVEGRIGQVLAMEFVPAAGRAAMAEDGPVVDPRDEAYRWGEGFSPTELPTSVDPPKGWLISCNNTPIRTDPPLTVTGAADDRFQRMDTLLDEAVAGDGRVDLDELSALQQDVHSPASLQSARAIASRVAGAENSPVLDALRTWDGTYTRGSVGAAAYQLTLHHLIETHYLAGQGETVAGFFRSSPGAHAFVAEDVASGAVDAETVQRAIELAAPDFARFGRWGDLHRLRLEHPLGLVPVLGRVFRLGEFPVPGSTSTIMKRAHTVTNRPHTVSFGANARHLSDMSDPDANDFVLLGGQDGWLGSTVYADQWPVWQRGEYIRLPMREDSIRTMFTRSTVLSPAEPRHTEKAE